MPMQQSQWSGVFPAITTPFHADGSVDHATLAAHVVWLADAGCSGIVTGGSPGEAAVLLSVAMEVSGRARRCRAVK